MKRRDVIQKLRKAAKAAGLDCREQELTRHTGITVGHVNSTLKRHTEIDEVTAKRFWDQYADVLGKGWWR